MSSKIRVMIVDDSVVVRRLVSDVLASDPAIEVAGVASTGKIGLAKLPDLNPDVLILDVEMPEMDGLETLQHVRKARPRLPVIMFSTLTRRGALTTLDALALGATDYLPKPTAQESAAAGLERLKQELIPKIKAVCVKRPETVAPAPVLAPVEVRTNRPPRSRRGPITVVVIATSTGGPNALAELIPTIPPMFPVPVLVVQHMPPLFTRTLAQRLDLKSLVHVTEAEQGERIEPGHVYIAPGDCHLLVGRDGANHRALLSKSALENSCRPAADVLFRSAAEVYGSGVLGVVLTGIGQDGMKGAEKIREADGLVFAQDEPSSVVWGMPGSVVKAGACDRIVPLNLMGPAIVRQVFEGRRDPALASL